MRLWLGCELMSEDKDITGNQHMSIDKIEEEIDKILAHERMDRRELFIRLAKGIGFLVLGTYIANRFDIAMAGSNRTGGSNEISGSGGKVKIKTTIVKVTNANSVDSSGEGQDGPVMDMVSRAIRELTGEKDVAKAWSHVAKKGDRVGLKVNCISGQHLSTQVPVAMAIVEGLKKAGIREQDIIIWDRTDRELTRAGYSLNANTDALRCFGTDKIGYQKEEQIINGTRFKLSKILTEEIDVLINVPIMKNHGGAGITLSLKNNYGSHSNPGEHHRYFCDPDCANINSHEVIRKKTRLIVVDALRAQCNGGPGDKPRWKWDPGMILMGFDTVATDLIGKEVIEERRREIGLDSLGQSARHIVTASKLGLGVEDRNAIQVMDIVMP